MTHPYTGLDKESGINLVSGATSRRLCNRPADENADSDTVPGVCGGGESGEPKGDARPEDNSDAVFGDTETLLPGGKGVEGDLHSKKRAASGGQEGKPSKKGKAPSSSGLGRASDVDVELDDEDEPPARP